ncbi:MULTISPECIES: hypothetical protein [Halobacteriovorax]|uniref:DUF4968 domain-containing protein n=1 Tax=Halobacteriovorax vibrionivorans TaxID=2152716 RepID=A0ABY0IEF3_9BACT|nr:MULTISPECIES: hypothetical protein [Halobacteriovorax]AYF44152.1 hypothetical protein BALOs_1145 [Halobacteriovorax sp. BALOs_7]RZF21323.1 hypothetical protein DAY19_06460 [Halobacteriovorax vibrionivorans]TGD47919.1 hypothetical protein EP118_05670 [Halobacteriovorax sp. Y22]
MKFLKMALLMTILFSCKEFKGNLSVTSELNLKTSKDSLTLAPGEYRTKVKFVGKRKMVIKVADEKLKVKFDDKLKLPSNGEFFLDKLDTSLNYDIAGTISTEVETGPIRHRSEFCEITHPQVVCNRRGECRTIYRRFPGRTHVEYRVDTVTKEFALDFTDAGQTYSTFSSTDVSRDTVYLYRGHCAIY